MTIPGEIRRPEASTGAPWKWPLMIGLVVIAAASFAIWHRVNKPRPEPEPMKLPTLDANKLAKIANANPEMMAQVQKIVAAFAQGAQVPDFSGMVGEVVPGEYWNVSGRVLDVINLQAVGGGRIVFFGAHPVNVVVGPEGTFEAELPKLTAGGYVMAPQPPAGYYGMIIGEMGEFANMLEEQRRNLGPGEATDFLIQSDREGIEIGVYPSGNLSTRYDEVQPYQEQTSYQEPPPYQEPPE